MVLCGGASAAEFALSPHPWSFALLLLRGPFARSDLDISDGCLDQYKHFETEKKYTRNLIATDGERFTLMLICWNGGKESPVHDHPCRGCWMRVCEGAVTETRFARKDGSLVEVGAGTFESPAVAYVHGEFAWRSVPAKAPPGRHCADGLCGSSLRVPAT